MNVLKGILKESQEYYQRLQKEIKKKIEQLPKGSVKKRNINGKLYYYLQYRENSKIKHKYLGKIYPEKKAKELLEVKKKIRKLKEELEKVKESIKILKRTERKKHV